MKNVLKVLVAVLLLSAMLTCALAETVTTTAAPAKYTGTGSFSKDEYTLKGTVDHTEGTDELKQVYVRITYFKSNGTYTIVPTFVADDGSFLSMYSGDVVHISVQIIDGPKIIPGTYNRVGGFEFDVE